MVSRRGHVLELAILGLLAESPMHGYELRKQLTAVLGWGRLLSYGSLYPALKDLLRRGLLLEEATAAVGRQRVVYHLTDAGQDRFEALVAHASPEDWDDEAFGVRMAFFGRTDAEIRIRILEGRRVRLQERLDRIQAQLDANKRRMDLYHAELQRHETETVEHEMSWLARLITAERTAQDVPPAQPPSGALGPSGINRQ